MKFENRGIVSTQSRHPELDSGSINVGLSRKGRSLREEWIDSGSESGMTQNCHAELVSASSHCNSVRILSNLIGGQTLKRVQGDKILKNLFTYSRTNLLTSKKVAFTLAEVLITLAIIGVVAALTIPTLVSNYKKQVVETKLAKFYSTMQHAMALSKIDNGDFSTWDKITEESIKDEETGETIEFKMNSVEWVNKYLAPYMKVSALERPGNLRGYWFILPDGSAFMPAIAAWNFCPDSNDIHLYYEKKDGQYNGNKFFTFNFDEKYGVQPYTYLWDGTRENLLNNTTMGCARNSGIGGPFCTKLIQLNNWKIPDDYPVKF